MKMKIIDFETIRALDINPREFYYWAEEAWHQKRNALMPPKSKMHQDDAGRYICMPCVLPSIDTAGVKFICRNMNDYNGIPKRNSNIMMQRCSKPGLEAVVDGNYITNMRTGAVAVENVKLFAKSNFKTLGLMGLGIAARAFFLIFCEMYKEQEISVKLYRYKDQAESFIKRFSYASNIHFTIVDSYDDVCSCDVVISCISNATSILCKDDVFKEGSTVIPVHTRGFQNCDLFFDKVFVDDIGHVKDFKYFDRFKSCSEVSDVVLGAVPGRINDKERIIAYCGGIALHDIYFARKIIDLVGDKCPDVLMQLPDTRFWI
jgi:alanine dehydrogenase